MRARVNREIIYIKYCTQISIELVENSSHVIFLFYQFAAEWVFPLENMSDHDECDTSAYAAQYCRYHPWYVKMAGGRAPESLVALESAPASSVDRGRRMLSALLGSAVVGSGVLLSELASPTTTVPRSTVSASVVSSEEGADPIIAAALSKSPKYPVVLDAPGATASPLHCARSSPEHELVGLDLTVGAGKFSPKALGR